MPALIDSDMNLTSAEYGVFPAGILTFLGTVICHVAGGGGAHVAPIMIQPRKDCCPFLLLNGLHVHLIERVRVNASLWV